jgi:hypothetical protein
VVELCTQRIKYCRPATKKRKSIISPSHESQQNQVQTQQVTAIIGMSESTVQPIFMGLFRYNYERAVPVLQVPTSTTTAPTPLTITLPRSVPSPLPTPLLLLNPSSPTSTPFLPAIPSSTSTIPLQCQENSSEAISAIKSWTAGFAQTFSNGVAAIKSGLNWPGAVTDEQVQSGKSTSQHDDSRETPDGELGIPVVDVTPKTAPDYFLTLDPPLDKCSCSVCVQSKPDMREVSSPIVPTADDGADMDGLEESVTGAILREYEETEVEAITSAATVTETSAKPVDDNAGAGAHEGPSASGSPTQAGASVPVPLTLPPTQNITAQTSDQGYDHTQQAAVEHAAAAGHDRLPAHQGSVIEPGVELDRTIIGGIGVWQRGRGVKLKKMG